MIGNRFSCISKHELKWPVTIALQSSGMSNGLPGRSFQTWSACLGTLFLYYPGIKIKSVLQKNLFHKTLNN